MSALDTAKSVVDQIKRRMKFQAQLAHDYRDTFERNPSGAAVLRDILRACGVLTVIEPPADADERSFAAGKRAIGIGIINRLRWSEAELVRLAREQVDDRLAQGDGVEIGA